MKILRFLGAALLLFSAVSVGVWVLIIMAGGKFIRGEDRARMEQMRHQFGTFDAAMFNWTILHRKTSLPSTLEEIKHALSAHEYSHLLEEPPRFREQFLQGRDPWGRPLIFLRRSDDVLIVRSVGPDGVDDDGQEDDMQVTIDVSRLRHPD